MGKMEKGEKGKGFVLAERMEVGSVQRRLSPFSLFPFSRSYTCNCSRGSAVVELVIILPVLLLIILAMMYVGEVSLYHERLHFGADYALNTPGDQSENPNATGTITDQFYSRESGRLTVTETAADPHDIPLPGEIRTIFEDMAQPVYSTYATGSYVFSGGELRFVISTHQSVSLTADGRYVASNRLLEDNVPELSTDLLQNWIFRDRAEMTYAYDPSYIHFGEWPLDAAQIPNRYQSTVRTDTEREALVAPTGGKHPVDTVTSNANMLQPGQLSGYPNFSGDEPFWGPN